MNNAIVNATKVIYKPDYHDIEKVERLINIEVLDNDEIDVQQECQKLVNKINRLWDESDEEVAEAWDILNKSNIKVYKEWCGVEGVYWYSLYPDCHY